MTIEIVRLYNPFFVPNKIDNDGDYIQYHDYDLIKDKPTPPLDWAKVEVTKLDELMEHVLKYTKFLVDYNTSNLIEYGVQLTYDLIGDLEYHSFEGEEEEIEKEV